MKKLLKGFIEFTILLGMCIIIMACFFMMILSFVLTVLFTWFDVVASDILTDNGKIIYAFGQAECLMLFFWSIFGGFKKWKKSKRLN